LTKKQQLETWKKKNKDMISNLATFDFGGFWRLNCNYFHVSTLTPCFGQAQDGTS
jgi:hypothetical protein